MREYSMDLVEQLRIKLEPQGSLQTRRLFTEPGNNFFSAEFVESCIADLEKRSKEWAEGKNPPTPLERLALHVLKDSAEIK